MVRKRKKIKPTSVLLSKAKRLACQRMPYLAALLYTARTIESPSVGTMAVDAAGRLYINPQFVQTLSVKHCAFILLHEMLHIVLSHAKRRAVRVPNPTRKQCDLWNTAADISVNGILQRDCRELTPEFGTFLHQFSHIQGMVGGLTTEQYYDLLIADAAKPPPMPPTPQSSGEDDEDGDEDDDSSSGTGDMDSEDEDDADEDESDDGDGTGSSQGGDDDSDEDDESDEDSDGGSSDEDGEADEEEDAEPSGDSSGDNEEPDDSAPSEPLQPKHTGSNSDGMPRDYEPERTVAEAIGQEGKLSEVQQAIIEHEASGRGNAPGELKQSLDVRLRPQPDPFDTLRSLVSKSVSSPLGTPLSTFRRLSRRQQSDMPRRRGEQQFSPECVVIVDTSGSMECGDYKERALVAVAQGLKRVHRPRIITCDAAIQSDGKVESMRKFKWLGGGGTDMTLAITHADSTYQPDAIVIVTDGETDWPANKTRARLVVALVAPPSAYCKPPEWAKVVNCTAERRGHAG